MVESNDINGGTGRCVESNNVCPCSKELRSDSAMSDNGHSSPSSSAVFAQF